jgi:moderate conductance mechanosensitive channel
MATRGLDVLVLRGFGCAYHWPAGPTCPPSHDRFSLTAGRDPTDGLDWPAGNPYGGPVTCQAGCAMGLAGGRQGTAAFGAGLALCVLLTTFVLGGICGQARAADVADQAAQARSLIASPQGAALLDLLGDPAVRQHLLAAPASQGMPVVPGSSVGQTLDDALGVLRGRFIDLATELRLMPAELRACWDRFRTTMLGTDLRNVFVYVILFIIGGIVAQRLFLYVARPWAAHFERVPLDTLRQRGGVLIERTTFGILLLGAFTAGSMGIFLLFDWPASSGSIILGYLWATLEVRLTQTATRFFFAPGAERLRLVPLSTREAWFWHRWMPALVAVGAFGWQSVLLLRVLGLPPGGVELLRQLLLLALALCGIVIVWSRHCSITLKRDSPRRTTVRVLASSAMLLIWMLFLTHADQLAWSIVVIGVVPIALYMFSNAALRVVSGRWAEECDETSAGYAITKRFTQALVMIAAALVLVELWQVDMASVADSDSTITRLGRGAFEALVILVGADLLWLIVRAIIDLRLTGAVIPIDDLDDDEIRHRARIRTLLPVLRNFLFIFVLIIASLSALSAMGLQIGPLLAGAGVVGIAVGFGAQTLVRDVLSGVFFLLDDAFRVGELIESGGISGTVEAFSLRSVILRHYKGPLHTVPFGDLKAITNYSRDWVNELLEVIVAYDADLAKVEEAIGQVSAAVMEDQVLTSAIIDAPVSLGVTAMDTYGMHVGIVVRTRPGQQFRVRAVLFNRLKSTFDAEGIRFSDQTRI